MKHIISFLLILGMVGCNLIPGHYRWSNASDSSHKYFALLHCAYKCEKEDSIKYYNPIFHYWSDSVLRAINAEFPAPEPEKKDNDDKTNCNCK